MSRRSVVTEKILTPEARRRAMPVIEEVYLREKSWIDDPAAEIPPAPGAVADRSWFLVSVDGEAAGVVRLLYDPSLEMPAELGLTLDREVDLDAFRRGSRVVEVGRLMILPSFRRNVRVVLSLMKAAVREVVDRGYTHFITDVFEGDPHSPLKFHTRVLGFERIGTHRRGELRCERTRIILILDIATAYERMKRKQNRLFREFTEGVREVMEARRLRSA